MLTGLKHLWRSNRLLLIAFLLATTLTIGFGVRMLAFSLYWNDPTHQNQPIEGWMTPRYVALSYGLEPDEARMLLGLGSDFVARITLREIAQNQHVTLQALQNQLDAYLASRATE